MTQNAPRGLQAVRWLTFSNRTSESIPPWSCLQVTGLAPQADTVFLGGQQFDGTGTGVFAFSGPGPVAAGVQGSCTLDFPAIVTYDASATPSIGETWVPKAGQWALTQGSAGDTNGFLVVGPLDTAAQTMWVMPAQSSQQMAIVTPTDNTSAAIGLPIGPFGSCCYAGAVRQILTTAPTMCNDTGGNRLSPSFLPAVPNQTCWIVVIDPNTGFAQPNATINKGEPYLGMLVGQYTISGKTLPFYAVKKGQQTDCIQISTSNSLATGSGSATNGQLVKAGSDGTFAGTVETFTASVTNFRTGTPWTAGVTCWLVFVDVPGGSAGSTAPTAICGDQYLATLLGVYNGRPLYATRGASGLWIVKGTLQYAMSPSSGSGTLSGPVSLTGGAAPAGPLTVQNTLGLAGPVGSNALAIYDASVPQWTFLQVQHALVTVLIGHQWTGSAFQYQTQQIAAMTVGSPSAWVTEVTGVDCPDGTDG